MKKKLTFLIIGSAICFTACGPSAKEKAAKEKVRQDSIHASDSLKIVIQAEQQKRIQDSLSVIEQARQESITKTQTLADSKAKSKESKKPTKSKK